MAMVNAAVDRGYQVLLTQLSRTQPTVPLDAIHGALCHYLVHLPPTHPTPAPLTAAVAASPLYHNLGTNAGSGSSSTPLNSLLTLGAVYRTALTQKWEALKKQEPERGLFDGSAASELSRWVRGMLSGLKGGDALICLAISGGLLSGLEFLGELSNKQSLKRRTEDVAIVAYAEVIAESVESSNDPWSSEFRAEDKKSSNVERLNIAVLLSAQYFQFVSNEALTALRLPALASIYCRTIDAVLISGHFLQNAEKNTPSGLTEATLKVKPLLVNDLATVTSSDGYKCISSLCKLLGRIIQLLCDTHSGSSRRSTAWSVIGDVTRMLKCLIEPVEDDWAASVYAHVNNSEQIDGPARQMTDDMWNLLKTLLFSTLLLQQASISALLYLHPAPSSSSTEQPSSAPVLCQHILEALSSLSFVIQAFGGVTASQGIPELKRVFYTAIDILSADRRLGQAYVKDLIHGVDSLQVQDSQFNGAKRAFALTCVEQFVPILSDECIETVVLPFCEPHLEDPSHRECYESAHSVMLAIFAAHAERSASSIKDGDGENLSRKLAPGYVKSLLRNAQEGKLNTYQFRLAFAALVRSASTGATSLHARTATAAITPGSPSLSSRMLQTIFSLKRPDMELTGDPALAWLCIESLLSALSTSVMSSPSSSTSSAEADSPSAERTRLTLALISCISNISPALLPRLLTEVERTIEGESDMRRRRALVDAVFAEITEHVGAAEKASVMRWWFGCSRRWEDNFQESQEVVVPPQ